MPVMTTLVPAGPLVGLNDVIVGTTRKFTELVAVPPGVVTAIGPVVAAGGTVAVIWVSELKMNAAETPSKVTEVAPVNPVPSITTLVPTGPLAGANEMIVTGDGVTSKFVALTSVPSESVTSMFPSEAPAGTVAVICVSELTVKVASTLLNSTSVAAHSWAEVGRALGATETAASFDDVADAFAANKRATWELFWTERAKSA